MKQALFFNSLGKHPTALLESPIEKADLLFVRRQFHLIQIRAAFGAKFFKTANLIPAIRTIMHAVSPP